MVSKREYDSLFTRYQIVERRRNEDRERLRELERLEAEEKEWEKLREKIKGRLEVVVSEGKELKREVRLSKHSIGLPSATDQYRRRCTEQGAQD